MDIEELRGLIRDVISKKIDEIRQERSVPPKSFSDFKILFDEALDDTGSRDQVLFEDAYDLWENVSAEASNIEEWNESLDYYVKKLSLSDLASRSIISKLRR